MSRWSAAWLLACCATAVVVAAVVAAVAVLGSPSEQRQHRLDERRVRDLTVISSSIRQYVDTHGVLPPDLATLGKEPGPGAAPVDPGTGSPYEYKVLAAESYLLCAVFATSATDAAGSLRVDRAGWTHKSGRQCFERKQAVGKN